MNGSLSDSAQDGGVQKARIAEGDRVLSGDDFPVGKVDAVLDARSGRRLVVAVAYSPGRFLALGEEEIAGSEMHTYGLRWHRLRLAAADVARLTVYRRVLGRLTAEPLHALLRAAKDDAARRSALLADLREDPLTADSQIDLAVAYGVAVLNGWVASVGAKVAAGRLARTTSGIWDVENRLASDEEIAAVARTRVVGDTELAQRVAAIQSTMGRLVVRLRSGAEDMAGVVEERLAGIPGCRHLSVEVSDKREGEGA